MTMGTEPRSSTTCLRCGRVGPESRYCPDCGARLAASAADLVDGRYALGELLGGGSYGRVYRATDVFLGRPAAIKIPSGVTSEPEIDRFRREAASLAAIRSEHVVQVYSFGPRIGGVYFAMELVEGPTLAKVIADHKAADGQVPLRRALKLLRDIAAGIAAIHAAGFVHRDIKPHNVVIERLTGRAVIVDFGLALTTDQASAADQVAGTALYMAPEVLAPDAFGGPDGRADQYAFGCLAYEVLTGRLPIYAATVGDLAYRQISKAPAHPSSLVPRLAPLDAILLRMLAKLPEHRFGTMDEVGAALESVTAELFPKEPLLPSDALELELELDPPSTVLVPAEREEPRQGRPPCRPRRVLVVDDDPAFRKYAGRAVEMALCDLPVQIKLVRSGSHALLDAREKTPDLLILDWDMPGLNGVETLSRLRESARASGVRVLVVSGHLPRGERWRFEVLGVQDFLEKPVEFASFLEVVSGIAERERWLDPVLPRDR